MLYVAIGILGATVMPHNLYLHSSIVQTRKYEQNAEGKREAIKFATIDSTTALMFALFINAAILIVSAATFHSRGQHEVAEIQDAYRLLSPTLTVPIASVVFALALLASGQNSTLTGTLAGQIVMEGFLNIRLRPWLRRGEVWCGGFPKHPPAPGAAPADSPPDRDYPRRDLHGPLRRKGHGET